MMKIPAIISLLVAIVSCSSGPRTVRNPQELYGSRMTLPESKTWVMQERDTTVMLNDRAKIVVYYNEEGCTPCRLNELHMWKAIIEESLDENSPVNADFVFIMKSDPLSEELRQSLISVDFRYPVLCDAEGEFETNNVLPKDIPHHVFLLSHDDKVILTRAPIFNPELWALYRRKIEGLDSCTLRPES